ncbi:FAD:protein FMN transferase [Pseudalkalibacillus caeni]|uniref:FAD:protein FMN transferase n=1 Tax=Exobacillus caeni TaxID=2574798 RepID=A0A5R9F0N1_9BACL|nr:FAD:protein FMN transferase [Pseudalkalibacillus caeni]TLS35996.1 FAD:protein FMN transferase [Pseudalkalibacillus caeni]
MTKSIEFSCMGSSFFVEAENHAELKQWFNDIEQTYSRFRNESYLSWFNRLEPSDKWVTVSPDFYSILVEVTDYMKRMDGLFNPFLGAQLKALGYDRPFSEMKRRGIKACLPAYHENKILLHSGQPLVKKLQNVELDLGGFVKGWSVDRAYHMARGHNVFIDGGGDMRFSFAEPEVIGIMNPFDSNTDIVQLKIRKGAIATSNVLHRRWQTEDGFYHHILNGKTGENPESDVVQVTVLASSVREAEVYAKVLCMMNGELVESWLGQRDRSIAAIVITDDKKIRITENIAEFCEGVKTAWSSQHGNGQGSQV